MEDLPGWVRTVNALAPLFLSVAAVIAASIAGFVSWTHGRRDRWWKKAEWALDLTRSDNEDDQVLGLAVFDALADQAPSLEELALIAAVTDGPLDRFEDDSDTEATYVLENEEGDISGEHTGEGQDGRGEEVRQGVTRREAGGRASPEG